jgi:hypothetical protein
MRQDIHLKLQVELAERITTERQVVYILVELRKLLELGNDSKRFPVLNFFCDWAVHVLLTYEGARRLVRRFNRVQMIDYEAKWNGRERLADEHLDHEFDETLNLRKFREELAACLTAYDFDYRIGTDRLKWREFIVQYAKVVEACPLRCRDSDMEYVDEVILTFIDLHDVNPDEYSFAVRWSWVNKKTGGEARAYGFL